MPTMAHGIGEIVSADGGPMKMTNNNNHQQQQAPSQQPSLLGSSSSSSSQRKNVGVMGSRRIFAAAFKLKVLDSYRNDIDCRGNQRATARKYGIHRRQIQKWLQCEDNLRSSCAESTSTTTVTSSGCCSVPVVSNSGVASTLAQGENTLKPEVTTAASINSNNSTNNCVTSIGAAGASVGTPIVAPAAPALNLSLARLHGDEHEQQLAARPPPHLSAGPGAASLRHSAHREPSPTSLSYPQQHSHAPSSSSSNSLPLRNILGYADYSSQQDTLQHQHQRHHRRQQQQQNDDQQLRDTIKDSGETKYSYVINPTGNYFAHSPNSEAYYQTLESYHNIAGYRSENSHNNRQGLIASLSYQEKKNVELAGNVREPSILPTSATSFASSASSSFSSSSSCYSSSSAPASPFHATAIKSERASPDSLATPGLCETPGSPESAASVPVARLHHQQQQQHNHHQQSQRLDDYDDAASSTKNCAAIAVHSIERTSPHVHVTSIDSHAFSARDSEKHQQQHVVKVEYEERMRVKEEMAEREEIETNLTTSSETHVENSVIERSTSYHHRRTDVVVAASCHDYQGASPSGGCSTPVSPVARDSSGSYSAISSPRAASSSGISTSSSCSDSEIDPLDYSNSAKNNINDLSRRRSFSLRFKLDVLDAFHRDTAVAGNQRATARKFGINRRQVQKWLGQENELRGEIALRGGDLRQRLGHMTESNAETSPVDLRTCLSTHCQGVRSSETKLEHESLPLYCCDVGSSSQQRLSFYNPGSVAESPESIQRTCTLSCCADGNATSIVCYPESARRSSIGYPESQSSLYCYSPRDSLDINSGNEAIDVASLPLKRTACNLTCCYDSMPSPKRICLDSLDETPASPRTCQDVPPQDAPLCLVKPKNAFEDAANHTELVSSTVPTPPAQTQIVMQASKKNAILFKPYLDNPVSKPTDDDNHHENQTNQRGLSPLSAHNVIANNNNNCHGICNLNEERSIITNTQHDYALELSLRVPVTWRTQNVGYGEFPERLRSAFVRYPTSPHYT